MAANLNRVFLIGNLTRDPELRYVPSGTAVTNFDLAVNRVYVLQSGEKKEDTCFIRIVVWGRRAEVCAEYLTKGSPAFVEGRLRSRSWETKEGQKRYTIEVVALSVQFLRSGQKKAPPAEGANSQISQESRAAPENVESIDLNSTKEGSEEIPF